MLVIVRTARRDDAKNAAQLLASMTRGDSRDPVTFEAREALWFLQALTKLKTIPEGADTEALKGLEERLRTRMGGLAKDERMRVADQIKQRIEELEHELAGTM